MLSKLDLHLMKKRKIWAVEKAPFPQSQSPAKFPLIIWTHGITCTRTSYSSICTYLASHGYIVAAIEHR